MKPTKDELVKAWHYVHDKAVRYNPVMAIKEDCPNTFGLTSFTTRQGCKCDEQPICKECWRVALGIEVE